MPASLETPATSSQYCRRHPHHDQQQYSSRDRHPQSQQQPPPVQPRSKRAVPNPSLNSLRSSLSQVSLDEGYSNNGASTSSLSLHLPQRQHKQDSGVDLQEMPFPSRRSNRDFRIIPPDEMPPIGESILQPRTRPSQSRDREHKERRDQRDQGDHTEPIERRENRDRETRSIRDTPRGRDTRDKGTTSPRNASREDTRRETRERDRGPSSRAAATAAAPSSSSRRGLYTLSNNSSGNLLSLEGSSATSPSLPLLQISIDKSSGPVRDEEDSYFGDILDKYCNSDDDPTSPSTASPTSPFSSAGWKDYRAQPPTPPVSSSRQFDLNQSLVPPRRSTPLRNQRSASPQDPNTQENDSHNTGASLSPMLAASAKFNMYLHAGAKDSKDSLAKANGSSQGSSSSHSPLPSARSYTKRPPPVPKDSPSPSSSTTPSPRVSAAASSSSSPMMGVNRSTPDLRSESRPEPPPKDRSRAVPGSHSNGSMSQLPLLSLETQSSNGQFSTFSSVVEATMNRHKTLSVASNSSTSPYYHSQDDHPQSRTRSGSHSQSNHQSSSDRQSGNYHQVYQNSGHSGSVSSIAHSLNSYDESKYPYGHHSHNHSHGHSHHNGSPSKSSGQDARPHGSHHGRHHNSPSSDYNGSYSQKSSQPPTEMLNRRFDDRARSSSQTSASTTLSRQQSYSSSPNPNSYYARSGGRLKSALSKTPIARARAREAHGPRKVIFGDMITIVSIERSETPPPPPMTNKKDKKKKKDKKGGQGHDPDYDADYYNTPYTPEPAEVVVTLAPWIGNPNYDEERANSKFYYEDDMDYEYDDYDYETPYENDIRLGPEDDDEDEDEDEDEPEGRAWGHGIAGGGSVTKKKGGMFKFKKAVNRLLRN